MDRSMNVRTVCAAPYSESGLDGTFSKRKVYHPASCADGSGTACAVLLSGVYAERDSPLTSCFRFSGHPGRNIIRKESPYGVCLLGICMDVPPSGNSLEYGDKNGRKAIPKAVICPEMDCTRGSIAHCRIWDICVYQTGDRKLYVSQNTFCVF